MNEYELKNFLSKTEDAILTLKLDTRELYKRIDEIKTIQLQNQRELLDLSHRLNDNLQRDIDAEKELQKKIEAMASKAGRGAGIKWGAIITAIGGVIVSILQAMI